MNWRVEAVFTVLMLVGVLRKQASPLKFYPALPQPLFAYSIYLVL